ncbi:hypothetical protein Tco_0481874 [Tanacetum coccineum]
MADHYQKWHDGTSTRNKSSNASDGLAAIQAQLNNLGSEIKKVNEILRKGRHLKEAYYTQFRVPFLNAGRYRATALRFYQRDNGNTSYQERRQTMEESLNKFMAESAKRHDEHSALINSTETNPRDHVKSITTTEEVETPSICRIGPHQYIVSSLKEDDKIPLIELSRVTIPFPSRLKENGYDEKKVMKELKKLQVNSTESATSLRIMIKESQGSKRRSKQQCTSITLQFFKMIYLRKKKT